MIIRSTKEISNQRFSILIVGESGVGKTSTAKTLPSPHSEILIISAESGLACLAETDIPTIVINPNHPWKEGQDFVLDPENPMYSLTDVFIKLNSPDFKKRYKYVFIVAAFIAAINLFLSLKIKID